MTTSDIAKIAYEATKAYNEQIFGDFSQKRYDALSDDRKQEYEQRVIFRFEHRNAPASSWHDRWLAQRLYDGWSLADFVDSKQKKHNRLIPWSMLPQSEQLRDRMFCRLVDCLIEETLGR